MRYTNRHLLAIINHPRRGIALKDAPGDGGTGDSGGGTGNNDGGDDKGDSDTGDKKPDIKGDLDPDRAARSIAAARDGEKKAKAELKAEKDRVAAILKAAGLTPDGTQDPAEALKAAAAERDKATAAARDNAIELAIFRKAGKAGADPDRALDSRSVMAKFADLDPAAGDFGDKVEALLKQAVKNDPGLAASGATKSAGKSGGEFDGGSGGPGTAITEEQLAKMSSSEIAKAYAEGKLKHLM